MRLGSEASIILARIMDHDPELGRLLTDFSERLAAVEGVAQQYEAEMEHKSSANGTAVDAITVSLSGDAS